MTSERPVFRNDKGQVLWGPLGSQPYEFIGWTTDQAPFTYAASEVVDMPTEEWAQAMQALRGGTIVIHFPLRRWHVHMFGPGVTPADLGFRVRHLRTRRARATSLRYRAWRCIPGT